MASITLRPTSDSRNTRVGLDWWLVAVAATLAFIGILSIYSSRPDTSYYRIQIRNILLGVVPMSIFTFVNPRLWSRALPFIYSANILILAAVLLVGDTAKGAERWIQLGPIQFQPSEVSKILIVISLASFYAMRMDRIREFGTFALGLLHIALPMMLILAQPHLGSTLLMLTIWIALSLVAGIRPVFVFPVLAFIALFGGLIVGSSSFRHTVLLPYQAKRVDEMVNKSAGKSDTQGGGYQQLQASYAFAAGGVSGTGYMKGEIKKRVPDQHTDFIFSLIGEEFGLLGTVGVVGLFGGLFYRLWLGIIHAADDYYKMLIAGIMTVFVFHTIVNISMVLGIAPVVGMWCPFLSSGGTAVWLCMSLIGLAINVRLRERAVLF